MVSKGPAVGAHKYAEQLWRLLCDNWYGGYGFSYVEATYIRKEDGKMIRINKAKDQCPEFKQVTEDPEKYKNRYDGKTENGAMVIQAARLGPLAKDGKGDNMIEDGQKTSDLAMFAMMEKANKTIYFSQQDMLPVILRGPTSLFAGRGGFDTCYIDTGCTGMTGTSFDDTWRKFSGIARAVSRGVEVSIMVSAPCAYAADNPTKVQTSSQFSCPTDGTQGEGYDYWDRVYIHNGRKWPKQRLQDQMYAHITKGMSELGAGSHSRRLSYGYGWSLENIADWIFAYYAINKYSRPRKADGTFKNADEVADHICEYVKIAHSRLNKDETTYMRGDKNGGQIGNHAKVLMVDEEIFYIGSDNAYGGGLAEFGLIIDDSTRTKDFADTYWRTLWNEAKGVNDTALVSGGPGECKWKKDHFEYFGWVFSD